MFPGKTSETEIIKQATSLFQRHFKYAPPHTVAAPVSIPLFGIETLPAGGLVACAVVNYYVAIAADPTPDGKVRIAFSYSDEPFTAYVDALYSEPWPAGLIPLRETLITLQKRGIHFTGFKAAVAEEIPHPIKQARDGALIVATSLMVRRLRRLALTPCLKAKPILDDLNRALPLTSEERINISELAGEAIKHGGLTCHPLATVKPLLYAKPSTLVVLDTIDQAIEYIQIPGVLLLLAWSESSGLGFFPDLDLFNHAYLNVARLTGHSLLRKSEPHQLAQYKAYLDQMDYALCLHTLFEIRRIAALCRLADQPETAFTVGRLFTTRTQELSSTAPKFAPYLTQLLDSISRISGILGAGVLMGTIMPTLTCIVEAHMIETCYDSLSKVLKESWGKNREIWVSTPIGALKV